jgi:AcrR family transcriptional regulator
VITVQLIAEHDVSGISVDMIAEKAGVSKATIYRRWSSRDELIYDAMSLIEYPQAQPDTGSLRGDLAVLLKGLVVFLNRPDGGRVYAAFLNTAMRDAKLSALRRKIARKARSNYEAVIRRAIERGELRRDTDIKLLIDMLIAPFIYRRIADNSKARPSEVPAVIDIAIASFQTGK